MSDLAELIISLFLIFLVLGVGLYTILNIFSAIINYKKPELFCGKCGKRVSRKAKRCPKCKIKLKHI